MTLDNYYRDRCNNYWQCTDVYLEYSAAVLIQLNTNLSISRHVHISGRFAEEEGPHDMVEEFEACWDKDSWTATRLDSKAPCGFGDTALEAIMDLQAYERVADGY